MRGPRSGARVVRGRRARKRARGPRARGADRRARGRAATRRGDDRRGDAAERGVRGRGARLAARDRRGGDEPRRRRGRGRQGRGARQGAPRSKEGAGARGESGKEGARRGEGRAARGARAGGPRARRGHVHRRLVGEARVRRVGFVGQGLRGRLRPARRRLAAPRGPALAARLLRRRRRARPVRAAQAGPAPRQARRQRLVRRSEGAHAAARAAARQLGFEKPRGVPQLVAEVAVLRDAVHRERHVLAGRHARHEGEPQRVGAVLVDDVEGVDDVALRLRHFFVVLVSYEPVHVDDLERRLSGELQAHHDHSRDPEEQDVVARLETRRRVELVQVRGLFGPADRREGPEPRREPRVQHVAVAF
mmetsp:Transcript_2264/g.6978  ORF Transcript_2264/g.6978 Transcript_2264/m.6978 type:complete len:363 (-) Transcript_2264:1436-2524(-)